MNKKDLVYFAKKEMDRLMISREAFKNATGRKPVQDDLKRVNCKKAGEIGHLSCGWCCHNLPVFECTICTLERINSKYSKALTNLASR